MRENEFVDSELGLEIGPDLRRSSTNEGICEQEEISVKNVENDLQPSYVSSFLQNRNQYGKIDVMNKVGVV